jgi:hypothetical protein
MSQACEKCGGAGFIIIEHDGVSAAKPCPCRPAALSEQGTPLDHKAAAEVMEIIFDLLDFSPRADRSRAILAAGFRDMCRTVDQAKYVIDRLPHYYTRWAECGLAGLRQILSQRYLPKDGRSLSATKAYPEGLPPQGQPESTVLLLPPGAVTAEPQLDQEIRQVTAAHSIQKPRDVSDEERKHAKEFERALENLTMGRPATLRIPPRLPGSPRAGEQPAIRGRYSSG